MGVRLIVAENDDYTAMYDSTTMRAFGPVFLHGESAEAFLKWLGVDPRILDEDVLADRVSEFRSRFLDNNGYVKEVEV